MNAAQPSLFGIPARGTFDSVVDGPRAKSQRERVKSVMEDGNWYTLAALAFHAGGSEAAVSARLRDLRKREFGGYTIEAKRLKPNGGTWVYRMVRP